MERKNYFNKFWRVIHIRNLVLSILIGILLIYINDKYWPCSELFREFVIVFIAGFTVSAYFEFFLRKGISEDNIKLYEMKEELGKSGIVKYYPNFKDIVLREFFRKDVKFIDIYVHFGDTMFGQISDSLYNFCKIEGNQLNIFILSPDNKFIIGLGELWGSSDKKYDEAGIRNKILSAKQTVVNIFDQLIREGNLKAKVTFCFLKKHPVFYSFYRFDDTIIYVPSKIVEQRTIIPPAFLLKNTFSENDLFNKCMNENEIIKSDSKNNLDVVYTN